MGPPKSYCHCVKSVLSFRKKDRNEGNALQSKDGNLGIIYGQGAFGLAITWAYQGQRLQTDIDKL